MINKNQIHLSLSFELKDNPINNGKSGASPYKKDICHVIAKVFIISNFSHNKEYQYKKKHTIIKKMKYTSTYSTEYYDKMAG